MQNVPDSDPQMKGWIEDAESRGNAYHPSVSAAHTYADAMAKREESGRELCINFINGHIWGFCKGCTAQEVAGWFAQIVRVLRDLLHTPRYVHYNGGVVKVSDYEPDDISRYSASMVGNIDVSFTDGKIEGDCSGCTKDVVIGAIEAYVTFLLTMEDQIVYTCYDEGKFFAG